MKTRALLAAAVLAAFSVTANADPLCENGHPAHRRAGVSYGGLPPRHGFVRDHCLPLGLGGPDTAANIQYQTHEAAQQKDMREWAAIEDYCAGRISLQQARSQFHCD